jgi:predicted P-loop ATPase
MAKQRTNNTTHVPAHSDAGHEFSVQTEKASEQSHSNDNSEQVKIKIPALVQIEKFLNCHYNFRKNMVSNRIEVKTLEETEYYLLTDYILNSILRKLKNKGIQCNLTDLRSITNSDYIPEFDPFVSYFNNLPPWDGVTDHISQLASLVETKNNELFQKMFKKWLVALVACSYNLQVVNHAVLVLTGVQGSGKTTFLCNILPKQLKQYVFTGTINPNSKDSLILLSECLLINLDELDSSSSAQIAQMKSIISLPSIKVRPAYGYHVENLIRRASFCGSVNHKEFLKDTSGSRRFICFESMSIDYNTPIQHDLVYAQAFTLFKNGFKYWFDGPEIQEINSNNEEFHSLTFEEELLLKYYEPIPENQTKLFLSTTDIASNLAEHQKLSITNAFSQNLGRALAKHKFVRVKKNGRYVYALKNKSISLSTSFSLAGVQEN